MDDRGYFGFGLFLTRIEDENHFVTRIKDNTVYKSIAQLYKRRWQIEMFFKPIKQNLPIKPFLGTSENACKAQIFVALTVYLLLELIRRNISKTYHCFGHFVTLIRVCLTHMSHPIQRYRVHSQQNKITVQQAKKTYVPPDTGQQKLDLG